MANTLERFAFDPPEGLESREYSPTYPESEAAIRAQLQGIPNQLRDKLNALIDTLSCETEGVSGADHIGAGAIPGFVSRRVGGQLRELYELMQNMTIGTIPDGSVTEEKLADGAVTEEKLNAPEVIRWATGTYTGTGTYQRENKNILKLPFEPRYLLIQAVNSNSVSTFMHCYAFVLNTSDYIHGGHRAWSVRNGTGGSSQEDLKAYAKFMDETKTEVRWYSETSEVLQMNESGITYTWFALR